MSTAPSEQVRSTFLDFFQSHSHQRISGTSVLAKNDPSLLFVNAGMVPLKPYFSGAATPPARELTNVQPCIRTIDIDDVGDRHHLTFFEMLGSWSIGGYFKRRAIELAYELLTSGFGFSPDSLYVTYFEGDASLGLPPDEESAAAWEAVGMARDHIVPQPMADNFWTAGPTGPCGPCTEVFLDFGEKYGPAWKLGMEFDTKRRYIEIWNAGVFMQYDRRADGVLNPLPFVSVDTGSGLERVTMAMNGYDSIFDVDVLAPIVATARDLFHDTNSVERHHRIVADHVRASSMIMAEGILPSNEGAGYVPRRLLRRCVTETVRHGVDHVDLGSLVATTVDVLGAHYPLLRQNSARITSAIKRESDEFSGVIRRGLKRLDLVIEREGHVSGHDAFDLLTTYGLPAEITRMLAAERGVDVAMDDFNEAFGRHREASRGRLKGASKASADGASPLDTVMQVAAAEGVRLDQAQIDELISMQASGQRPAKLSFDATDAYQQVRRLGETRFVGYDDTTVETRVAGLIKGGQLVDVVEAGDLAEVALAETPFYAESGGQDADLGELVGPEGALTVIDVQSPLPGLVLHRGVVAHGRLAAASSVVAKVDAPTRQDAARAHSATHVLHAALGQVLGDHAAQAGSYNKPGYLRFDFPADRPLSADMMAEVEGISNQAVRDELPVTTRTLALEEAKAMGAWAMFGEKYGPVVRMVDIGGPWSRELCGGTHVTHSGQIGLLTLLSERSVGAGVRRLEALVAGDAYRRMAAERSIVASLTELLAVKPDELVDRVGKLVANLKRAERAAADLAKANANAQAAGLAAAAIQVGSTLFVGRRVAHQGNELRALANEVRSHLGDNPAVVALVGGEPGSAAIVVATTPAARAQGHAANVLVAHAAALLGGRGGGRDDMAQGGGPNADASDAAIAAIAAAIGQTTTGKPAK